MKIRTTGESNRKVGAEASAVHKPAMRCGRERKSRICGVQNCVHNPCKTLEILENMEVAFAFFYREIFCQILIRPIMFQMLPSGYFVAVSVFEIMTPTPHILFIIKILLQV